MLSTPSPHIRSALQILKLQPNLIRSSSTHAFQQRRTPIPLLFHHQSSTRHASDTSTHPASTHPSATSSKASNPASVPPAKSNPESFNTVSSSSISSPSTSSPSSSVPLSDPPEPSSPSPSPTDLQQTSPLPWNTYLSLRRLRRRYSLLASLLTSTTTTLTGLTVIQTHTDTLSSTLTSLFGLDPIFMLGAATLAAGGAGWLLGPFVGEGIFRVVYRKEWGGMAAKEKSFYTRIRRYRVDPSLASYSNPLPDYYGEKIGSIKDFRTWMRDQRAYNRKRMGV